MSGSWAEAAELALTRSSSHLSSVWDLESGKCICQLGLTDEERWEKEEAEREGR